MGAQALEAWCYARSRCNSAVGDVFTGQLQSTLQCPDCDALSHSFADFTDVSLPLPRKSGVGASISIQVKFACSHALTTTP